MGIIRNEDIGCAQNSLAGTIVLLQLDDFQIWKAYTYLKNSIPRHEEDLDAWENRDNVPFKQRPYFSPTHSREDVANMKKRLEDFGMSFVAPVPVVRVYDED